MHRIPVAAPAGSAARGPFFAPRAEKSSIGTKYEFALFGPPFLRTAWTLTRPVQIGQVQHGLRFTFGSLLPFLSEKYDGDAETLALCLRAIAFFPGEYRQANMVARRLRSTCASCFTNGSKCG